MIENIYLTLTVRLTYHSMHFRFDYLSKMQGRLCKIKMLWLNLSRTLVLKNDLGFVEDRNQFHVGPGRRLVEFLLNMDPSVSVLAFICQNNDPAPWLMKSLSVFPSLRCLIKSRLVSCSFVWNASFNINFAWLWKMTQKISVECCISLHWESKIASALGQTYTHVKHIFHTHLKSYPLVINALSALTRVDSREGLFCACVKSEIIIRYNLMFLMSEFLFPDFLANPAIVSNVSHC